MPFLPPPGLLNAFSAITAGIRDGSIRWDNALQSLQALQLETGEIVVTDSTQSNKVVADTITAVSGEDGASSDSKPARPFFSFPPPPQLPPPLAALVAEIKDRYKPGLPQLPDLAAEIRSRYGKDLPPLSVVAEDIKSQYAPKLPDYPGPFKVGACHFETRPDGHATARGILATLFFPCSPPPPAAPSGTEGGGNNDGVWPTRAPWLPGPKIFYTTGYGDYMAMPRVLSQTAGSALLDSVFMPAYLSAGTAPWDDGVAVATGSMMRLNISDSAELPSRLPVVVFSHGLVGSQTTYSTIVGTLASRGFVCIAIEHREQSAIVSGINAYKETVEYKVPRETDKFSEPSKDEYFLRFRRDQLQQRYIFHWTENLDDLLAVCYGIEDPPNAAASLHEFAVILGTRHQDVSDLPYIVPNITIGGIPLFGTQKPDVVQSLLDTMICKFLKGRFHPSTEDESGRRISKILTPAAERELSFHFVLNGEDAIEYQKMTAPPT
ncbi:hypothetical protein HK405_008542, partial [Cladochytrium tenue]